MKNPFSLNFLFKKEDPAGKEELYYPVCPKCISPKIYILKEFTSGWLTSPRYVCSDCQYSGTIILEIDMKMLEDHTPEEIKEIYYEELAENFNEEEFEE